MPAYFRKSGLTGRERNMKTVAPQGAENRVFGISELPPVSRIGLVMSVIILQVCILVP